MNFNKIRKALYLLFTASVLILLTQCESSTKKQLVGVWKVTSVDLNGTRLDGATAGRWMWEFNDAGGYMIVASGMQDKGTYKLDGKTLKIKSVINADKPEATYTIQSIDTLNLQLYSETNGNKTLLYLLKDKKAGEEEVD